MTDDLRAQIKKLMHDYALLFINKLNSFYFNFNKIVICYQNYL